MGGRVGERITLTRKMKKNKPQGVKPGTGTSSALKDATRSGTAVARSATERCNAPDRCVMFVAEMTIQSNSSPTSSLSLGVGADTSDSDGDKVLSGEGQKVFVC